MDEESVDESDDDVMFETEVGVLGIPDRIDLDQVDDELLNIGCEQSIVHNVETTRSEIEGVEYYQRSLSNNNHNNR